MCSSARQVSVERATTPAAHSHERAMTAHEEADYFPRSSSSSSSRHHPHLQQHSTHAHRTHRSSGHNDSASPVHREHHHHRRRSRSLMVDTNHGSTGRGYHDSPQEMSSSLPLESPMVGGSMDVHVRVYSGEHFWHGSLSLTSPSGLCSALSHEEEVRC